MKISYKIVSKPLDLDCNFEMEAAVGEMVEIAKTQRDVIVSYAKGFLKFQKEVRGEILPWVEIIEEVKAHEIIKELE